MLFKTPPDSCNLTLQSKTVVECFENIVSLYKDKIAVVHQDNEITYGSLNAKANHLALHLNKRIQPGALVGVYLESSIDFLISILAILKAGGAYLPLDIETPYPRIDSIIIDSKPQLILTNTQFESQLASYKNRILNLDCLILNEIAQNPPPSESVANSLLYVMYTSGSTGSPKGCMIPHQAVLNLVKNKELIELKKHERMAQISNIAFDASTFEIWGALLNGATMFIFPRKNLFCLDDLSLFLKSNLITVLFLTTALFNLVVKSKSDCLDRIHYLLFGGEKANSNVVAKFFDRYNSLELMHLQVFHVYGPTENTTFSTKLKLNPRDNYEKNLPIGKPLDNIELYIFNEKLQEVSPGNMGEIYLGGANLALGYLNLADLSNSRFIQHPTLKSRFYKTGDFAYRDENGNIIFVCRMDSQIKIRGYRVDLNEIEATFLEHPSIEHAHIDVVLKGDDYNINAYIALNNDKTIESTALYHYLHQKLPSYMIPQKIHLLEDFPLNQNGKIDKDALRKMNLKTLHRIQDVHRPTNEVEKIITELLSDLLHEPAIGTHHNFFDLGFNSLMVTDACDKLNQKINTPTRIKEIDFFTYPTINLLAKFLSQNTELTNITNAADRAQLQRKIKMRKQHA